MSVWHIFVRYGKVLCIFGETSYFRTLYIPAGLRIATAICSTRLLRPQFPRTAETCGLASPIGASQTTGPRLTGRESRAHRSTLPRRRGKRGPHWFASAENYVN